MAGGDHLLGSPVELRTRLQTTGFVELTPSGDLQGWAWMPADPEALPRLRVLAQDKATPIQVIARDGRAVAAISDGVARPRYFHIPAALLPHDSKLRVIGSDGRDLLGSPLPLPTERRNAARAARKMSTASRHPSATTRLSGQAIDTTRPLPASLLPEPSADLPANQAGVPQRRCVDVIIPVFRDMDHLSTCLAALFADPVPGLRVILVDDGNDEPALQAYFASLPQSQVTLLRHAANRGFPAAANTGLRHTLAEAVPRDVILLHPDTTVPRGWLKRMQHAAYRRADIGSVTPMTNGDGRTSSPGAGMLMDRGQNHSPDQRDADFAAANAGCLVELPAASDVCLFIRHDCLAQVGLFRESLFAQGHGEDIDWSLRARHLGWRHVADTSIFVTRGSGTSFGPAGQALRTRNLGILERFHPGARDAIEAFRQRDPLAAARRRVAERQWRRHAMQAGSVILITHARGGGVEHCVQGRAADWRKSGLRPIIVRPAGTWPPVPGQDRPCTLADGDTPYDDLIFHPATDFAGLVSFLRQDSPRAVELHHLMGHDESLAGLATELHLPLDIHVHDYAMICPRVTFCGANAQYCGEPLDTTICDECVADNGERLHDGLGAASVRARSAQMLATARHIHTATREAARRMARYFPVADKLVITGRGDDAALPASPTRMPAAGARRICIPGAIGDDKGFRILLACARDAARRGLDLHFTVIGHTPDDPVLMNTGRVFVTGEYTDDEAAGLIAAHRPDLGFLPSVWPETWCYSLTLLWRAGLWPVAFGIGAQAERIAARGIGTILPLGLPPPAINDRLLTLTPSAM